LRHPNIIKYFGNEKNNEKEYIIVEAVIPIKNILKDLDFKEIIFGLKQVIVKLKLMKGILIK
jgi:hypothetical protein